MSCRNAHRSRINRRENDLGYRRWLLKYLGTRECSWLFNIDFVNMGKLFNLIVPQSSQSKMVESYLFHRLIEQIKQDHICKCLEECLQVINISVSHYYFIRLLITHFVTLF